MEAARPALSGNRKIAAECGESRLYTRAAASARLLLLFDHAHVAAAFPPGERWDVIVACDNPGTWAFHCHILPHAESDHGMFGMVTALVVQG